MIISPAKSRLLVGSTLLGLAVLAGCASNQPRYPERSGQPVPQNNYPAAQPAPYYGGQQPAPYYGGQQQAPRGAQSGYVESVETIRAENQTSGAGAVIGGVIGAVVGRQIGGGSGRDAATAVGVVGGAIAGNQIEKNRRGGSDFVRVTVRLDGGASRQFDYEPGVSVRQGDRVYVQGDQLMRY